jgi:hypothetical protein
VVRFGNAGEFNNRVETWLRDLNQKGYDIYFSVGVRGKPESTEDAVTRVVALHVDCDNDSPDLIQVPAPSIVVDSGHGRHLYWLLQTPVEVIGENRDRLKAINRNLAMRVGGEPACCDLGRLLRLPGYLNRKREPYPLVRLLELNAYRYRLEDFAACGGLRAAPPLQPCQVRGVAVPGQELLDRFHDLRRQDSSHEVTRAWRGEIGDGSSDSRFVLVKRLCESAEFAPSEILAIVLSRNWYNRREHVTREAWRVERHVNRLLDKQPWNAPVRRKRVLSQNEYGHG